MRSFVDFTGNGIFVYTKKEIIKIVLAEEQTTSK